MAPWHFPYSLLFAVEHKVSDNVCTAKYSKPNVKKLEDEYGDLGHALEIRNTVACSFGEMCDLETGVEGGHGGRW